MSTGKTVMTKVHHVALFVSDMGRALHLFRDILGFETVWHAPEVKGKRMAMLLGIPEVKLEMAYLQNSPNSVAVELCRMIHPVREKPISTFGSPGAMSLSLQAENLEKLHERLAREGWTPFSPCLEMSDPEGNPVRLFCFPTEEGLVVELIEKMSSASLTE